jgi:hypothetical protein
VTRLGEFSPFWVIIYFGQCFEDYMSATNFWATFFHGASYVIILTKTWWGYILGDFFANSSGRPY